MAVRDYTTRRQSITNALVDVLKKINGTGQYLTDVGDNVSPRLKFWDEIEEFPAIHLNTSGETRQYQAAGYKDRFLNITIRCYVNEENAVDALDALLEDVETVLEENQRLRYVDRRGTTHFTHQNTIVSIDTDEGVLDPLGVGEVLIEVRY